MGTLIGFLSASQLVGQSYQIRGQLTDTLATEITNQSVALYRDSTLITVSLTDKTGRFVFRSLPKGVYRIGVASLTYQPVSQRINLVDSDVDCQVRLIPHVHSLTEVVVSAKKPDVEMKPDRVVVNMTSNALLTGQTVLDAFAVVPRATLDLISRTIQVDGQPVTQLYVNDKRVLLPAGGVSAYLQTLPASTYTRLEILTNPPASYEASGGSVVLLYTKRPPSEGWLTDVTVSGGWGRYEKANASVITTWHQNRSSGFVIVTPLWRPTYFEYVSRQNFEASGYSDASQYRTVRQGSMGLQVGTDYALSPKTTVGASLIANGMRYYRQPDATVWYQIGAGSPTTVRSVAVNDQQYQQGALNLNLRHAFSSGRRLSMDADWAAFSDNHRTQSSFSQFSGGQQQEQNLDLLYPTRMKIGSAKVDYSKTQEALSWEIGAKYSLVGMDNAPKVNQLSAGFEDRRASFTPGFHYREGTGAFYSSATLNWKKWDVSAGLRIETTRTEGRSASSVDSDVFIRHYTYLFPNLSLSRKLGNETKITLAVNRRIVRPNFDLLNPAYVVLDALTFVRGNPFLKPTLNTNLSTTVLFPKRIALSLVHLDSRQSIIEVLYRESPASPTITNTSINFVGERRTALSLTIPLQLTPHWRLNGTLQGYYHRFSSSFGGENISTQLWASSLRLTQTYTLGKWQTSLAFTTRTRALYGYLSYAPIWYLDISASRTLNRGSSLKIACTDLFHTIQSKNQGQYLGNDIAFNHRFETRVLMVSYSFKLGNSKVKSFEVRSGGAEPEQERAGKQ